MSIRQTYGSPRWSMEILDCSMPMTFDTYSHCAFGCLYCTPKGSSILMADGTWKDVAAIEVGDEVIGFQARESKRAETTIATVEEIGTRRADVYEATMESGRTIRCTDDHRWYVGRRGIKHPQAYRPLTVGAELQFVSEPTPLSMFPEEVCVAFKAGYIHGIVDGDGCRMDKVYEYPHRKMHITSVRVCMKDRESLDRWAEYADFLGIKYTRFENGPSDLPGVRAASHKAYEQLETLATDDTEYWRGWLSGIYDAEGHLMTRGKTIRISQFADVNPEIHSKIQAVLSSYGFKTTVRNKTIAIRGGFQETSRFISIFDPAIPRKRDLTKCGRFESDRVKNIELEALDQTVYSFRTSTGNYVNQGYHSRNCFAFFQKEHTLHGYQTDDVRSVNPKNIERLFDGALRAQTTKHTKAMKQFGPYIRANHVMQWGAMADQFDPYEERHGVTLQMLRYFDKIDYPLSFSTKGTAWTKDERYMKLFARHTHNWHVKISIITWDASKAKIVEAGVPSPQERMAAIKRLTDIGIHVTLRLRPYMIGISEDWKDLIEAGKAAGADSVTTEFLCIEGRADEMLKRRYAAMSKVAGFDLWDFYTKNSPQHGYKRLRAGIKRPIMEAMRKKAHELGMRFEASDAAGRHLCDSVNCCGVPPEWNSQDAHFGGAVLIAQKHGEVRWTDISARVEHLFGGFEWARATLYNTGSAKRRAEFAGLTMADFIRYTWNNPKGGTSPQKMYGNVLQPTGYDENGDVIYSYMDKR